MTQHKYPITLVIIYPESESRVNKKSAKYHKMKEKKILLKSPLTLTYLSGRLGKFDGQ